MSKNKLILIHISGLSLACLFYIITKDYKYIKGYKKGYSDGEYSAYVKMYVECLRSEYGDKNED